MKGIPGSQPDGAAEDAFWILADRPGSSLTLAEVHARHVELITGLGDPDYHPLTCQQIRGGLLALAGRRPPLVESDQPGRGHPARWQVTRYGRRMASVWDGEPGREPCGLGWPSSDRIAG